MCLSGVRQDKGHQGRAQMQGGRQLAGDCVGVEAAMALDRSMTVPSWSSLVFYSQLPVLHQLGLPLVIPGRRDAGISYNLGRAQCDV